MGQVITTLPQEATQPVRIIATAVVCLVGLALTMMPWEHGAVKFVKDAARHLAARGDERR